MRRATKWRPWQFSLRFLLLLTTVIAVGAAFFGWRARQLEPQRRAVARIVELGGSVELERRGWIEAVMHGGDFDKVVGVAMPGHLADQMLPDLREWPSLKRVSLTYVVGYGVADGNDPDLFWYSNITKQDWKHYSIANGFVKASTEESRWSRFRIALPHAEVSVSEKLDDGYAGYLTGH